MNVVKIKSIKNLNNYISYIVDEERHIGQEIIELNSFDENIELMNSDIDDYKQNKRGRRPKPLSIMLSYPPKTDLDDLLKNHKEIWSDFFQYVSDENNLGLNGDDISKMISNIPSVLHYKDSNPHTHNLINRIFYSRNKSCLVSIDISKKQYHRKLMQLSGWNIQDKLQYKKSTSQYNYKLEQLQEELEEYRDLSSQAQRLVELANKDLKRGHTKKALKKLQKLQSF